MKLVQGIHDKSQECQVYVTQTNKGGSGTRAVHWVM